MIFKSSAENVSVFVDIKRSITVIMAAGSTIKKFCLNLSFISQPCVLTAAIVVSLIIERLSPNIAPHTTAPTQIGIPRPVFSAIPTAIGVRAVIVPTLVPIDTDIKQPIINIPTTAIFDGNI